MDRETFTHIVKDAAVKKRNKYDQFLSRIKILESLSSYERQKIADVLAPIRYLPGEYVIRQGDDGDTFYFVEEGTAVALKVDPNLHQANESW